MFIRKLGKKQLYYKGKVHVYWEKIIFIKLTSAIASLNWVWKFLILLLIFYFEELLPNCSCFNTFKGKALRVRENRVFVLQQKNPLECFI